MTTMTGRIRSLAQKHISLVGLGPRKSIVKSFPLGAPRFQLKKPSCKLVRRAAVSLVVNFTNGNHCKLSATQKEDVYAANTAITEQIAVDDGTETRSSILLGSENSQETSADNGEDILTEQQQQQQQQEEDEEEEEEELLIATTSDDNTSAGTITGSSSDEVLEDVVVFDDDDDDDDDDAVDDEEAHNDNNAKEPLTSMASPLRRYDSSDDNEPNAPKPEELNNQETTTDDVITSASNETTENLFSEEYTMSVMRLTKEDCEMFAKHSVEILNRISTPSDANSSAPQESPFSGLIRMLSPVTLEK